MKNSSLCILYRNEPFSRVRVLTNNNLCCLNGKHITISRVREHWDIVTSGSKKTSYMQLVTLLL